jgi:glycosyltransferase involved in cell wall biosynthesis
MTARVLWLTKGLGLGGAERLLSLAAARIDPERFAVEVAYLLPWKDAFVADLEAAGVKTHCLAARQTLELGWPARLRRLLVEGHFDVVHTHSPVPAAAARVLVRRPTRLVHTEHNLWDRYRFPTFAANALTYARNDAVIAVSDGVAASVSRPRWSRLGSPPATETLLHGVDATAIPHGSKARAVARARLGVSMQTPLIGCVANFTPKKDHAGLLEAFEQVSGAVPGARLLLIGSGPLGAELEASVTARGLAGKVCFLGARDDVLELLPALDVFVLGSRYEGLPIALLEAMAAGVSVVATEVGGIPEVIEKGADGVMVPPGRPDALARALRDLLLDEQHRDGLAQRGRAKVLNSFSIDRAVERTEQLYTELLARPVGAR